MKHVSKRKIDSTRSGESNATRQPRIKSDPGSHISNQEIQEFHNMRDGWHINQSLEYRLR
jgi:hypothetical protein